MARIKNGILGPIEGPVSQVTGYIRLGVPVIRQKHNRDSDKPRSEKQIASSNRFSIAMKFVKPTTPFINVGFSLARESGQTAHNIAVSKVLSAITGEHPNFNINYEQLMVADGSLQEAFNPRVELTKTRTLDFYWEQPEKQSYIRGRDQAMLLAYMPEENVAFYVTSGARRSSGQDLLEVCTGKPGQTFETYIAFISDDRKKISKSTYTGQIVIA